MSEFVFPEAIILSVQRSGTKVLLDALSSHPDIHGCGEMFANPNHPRIKSQRPCDPDKYNIGVLMYNHIERFLKLGGDFNNIKIIFLTRNPRNIAISRLQLEGDRRNDPNFNAHLIRNFRESYYNKRASLSENKIHENQLIITRFQNIEKSIIANTDYLHVNYEDFVKEEQNIEYLDEEVAKKILGYLDLEYNGILPTRYIKTGIYNERKE